MSRSLNLIVAVGDRDGRLALHEMLLRLGHQVVPAPSGRYVAEQCRRLFPDLVIADARVPELNVIHGDEVSTDREVPVLLLTDEQDADLAARAAAELHVLACLAKPVLSESLEAAIAGAVARSEQFRALRTQARGRRARVSAARPGTPICQSCPSEGTVTQRASRKQPPMIA